MKKVRESEKQTKGGGGSFTPYLGCEMNAGEASYAPV